MSRVLNPLLATAVLLGAWQALVTLAGLPPFILPGPVRVAEALVGNAGLIAFHAGATLIEVLIGLALGAILGTLTALGLVASPLARRIVRPALVLTQALPVFALAPILTLWLGYGMGAKIVIAVLIIYFPVTSAFFDGLVATPPGWLGLRRCCGGSGCRRRCRRWPRGCGWPRSMPRSAR
jgi:putative hydroxymethylpyrimidine transport system permease protein